MTDEQRLVYSVSLQFVSEEDHLKYERKFVPNGEKFFFDSAAEAEVALLKAVDEIEKIRPEGYRPCGCQIGFLWETFDPRWPSHTTSWSIPKEKFYELYPEMNSPADD